MIGPAKRVYADGHAKMTDEHGNVIYGTPVRAQRRFSRRLHRQRPGSDKRQDALHLAARRAFERRHHRAAERRIYRLRTVQGPSGTAAVLAGAGDQDRRKPADPHDLLRERSASVLGLSRLLVALFFVARRDRQQADRLFGAVDRIRRQSRRRLQHALFHQSGAELRSDPDSDLPVETGPAGRSRLAPAAVEWRLQHSRDRDRPAAARRLPQLSLRRRRPRDARLDRERRELSSQ